MQVDLEQMLGGMSVDTFLREYWQKKPLLIRNAFPGFVSPLTPEELAGLACEEDVNARLVLEKGGSRPWEVRYSPFSEDDFLQLPEDHYSLLVMDVEKHVPGYAELRDCFRFIPDWRIDDVMVSYAPAGGSVGAHTDQYDVFLLQAHGHRRWQLENRVREHEELVPDLELRILQAFHPDEDWVLAPGDMLYLPPGIPHHGVAQDRCMTISMGFRAPSHAELIGGFSDFVIDEAMESRRYSDPDLTLQEQPAEITPAALQKVRTILEDALRLDDRKLGCFFGEYLTDRRIDLMPLYPQNQDLDEAALLELLDEDGLLERNPASRFAFIRTDSGITLFADGEAIELPADMRDVVETLCNVRQYTYAELKALGLPRVMPLFTQLYNRGCLL